MAVDIDLNSNICAIHNEMLIQLNAWLCQGSFYQTE